MTPQRLLSALALLSMFAFSGGCGGGDADTAPATGGASSGGGAGASGAGGAGASGGASGSGGAAGSSGSSGSSGSGGGNSCNDPGPEPNDSPALATPTCGTPPCDVGQCNDDGSPGYGGKLVAITGTAGPGDTDVFRYDGKDTIGLCKVDAAAKTTDSGFRLCIFPSCQAATVLEGCTSGSMVDMNGLKGCCINAPGEAAAAHHCEGTSTGNDSAEVYVQIDQANSCVNYTVDYHF
ncbi:MAG: hypothetical protein R3B13_28525 [Polyangiaceae bacterium]